MDKISIENIVNTPKLLSPDQKAAALCKAKYIKVIAGAGTGKTETLTRRIAYLILNEKVEPSSIVAFTFTERAAQSMKERVYETIEKLSGKDSLSKLGEMYIGTIHAYAKKLLEDEYKFGIHTLLDDNQEMAFLLKEGWGLGLGGIGHNYSEACQTFLRTFNMTLDECLDANDLEKSTPLFFKKLKGYKELLNDNKLLTFGVVINYVLYHLKASKTPLKNITHLIVDEYQDINKAQFELIKMIGKNASVFVVGDPRQSIYQWRGSNEKYFNDFDFYFKGAKVVSIVENRRSGSNIVKNANKFAASFNTVKFAPMNPIRETGSGFIALQSLETPSEEAVWIADQIEKLSKKGNNLRYRDIGILTRSVGTSASDLISEFKKRNIRYIVGGKVGLFKRDDALALGQIFAWLYKESFWKEDKKDLKEDELLTSALAHWNAAQHYGTPKNAKKELKQIKTDLYSTKPTYPYTTELFQKILVILGFLNLDRTKPDDAVVIANIGRFNNILSDFEASNMIGGSLPSWPNRLKSLFWFIKNHASSAYEEQSLFEVGDIDAVQIMTVHQAKGLEWPAVFIFSLTDRRFPSSGGKKEVYWFDIPETLFDAKRYKGGEEDERRLFYVAITRPKEVLTMTYFKRLSNAQKKSRFLDNLDLTTIKELKPLQSLPEMKFKKVEEKDTMQTYSASEIILYDRCSYQFLLRNVWGFQPKINQYIGYGKALHFCLAQSKELLATKTPEAAVAAAVEDNFFLPYMNERMEESTKKAAKGHLVAFAKKYGDDLKRIREVEYRVEFPLSNTTITGKVDVILTTGGGYEVRDYKSSDQATTTEESSLQVRLYSIGLNMLGKKITNGSIAYLEKSKVVPIDVSKSELDKTRNKADSIAKGIDGGIFTEKVGDHCKTCDMLKICKYAQSYKVKKGW